MKLTIAFILGTLLMITGTVMAKNNKQVIPPGFTTYEVQNIGFVERGNALGGGGGGAARNGYAQVKTIDGQINGQIIWVESWSVSY